MKIVVFGLSVTSSWGNGHATTYRGLLREVARRGHDVLFLERDRPWYAARRDLVEPPYRVELYDTVFEMRERFAGEVADADAVIVGSYVPEAITVGEWVISTARGAVAFYDIDTPVTIDALERESCAYLTPELAGAYDLYLSFSGGPILKRIRDHFHSPRVEPLFCSVDPEHYFPGAAAPRWDLGYLGTYSADRQPTLEQLLAEPSNRLPRQSFVVAGPQYPADIPWSANVARIEHLGPDEHRNFYARQRFTLNVTRAAMIAAGHSPSVRLFEAAACAVPVISDHWDGIEDFFEPGREILLASTADDVVKILRDLPPEEGAVIGRRARERVLREHTSAHRAAELERMLEDVHAMKEVTA